MAIKPIKVSQLNKYIGRVLQTDPILGNVSVTGEISNLKYHSSGHVYFTLKDESGKVNCFIPVSTAAGLKYELTDGMQVIIYGYVSVYEKGGYYSLNVKNVEISGEGGLMLAFKAMYDRLKKEGIFDEKYKKPLPIFPQKICVVTSPTGAAVRDIIKIIHSRNDFVDIIVYPCLVQGENAAAEIAAAIDDINARISDADLIIVGRGGGSLEELWAFNEEIVARSIFNSVIPVISAVGHETDVSISDYAADRRAETPTAAAAMAVPDISAVKQELEYLSENISAGFARTVSMRSESLKRYSPETLSIFAGRRVQAEIHKTKELADRMSAGIKERIRRMSADIERFGVMLDAGDPERIIQRGYTVVSDADSGRIISDISAVESGMNINVRFCGGNAAAAVTSVDK